MTNKYKKHYKKYKKAYLQNRETILNKYDQILNPELKIIPIGVADNTYNIIRDDLLIGGTKQRIIGRILLENKAKEFVYAGPNNGYAQIALSYVAQLLNKKATIFLATQKPKHKLTQFAQKFNPNIIEIGFHKKLKDVQTAAEEYVDKIKLEKGSDYIYMIPFGLYSEEFITLLASQINKALPTQLKDFPPKRMWLVAGSATILNALYKVFPDTFFNVIQVGKTIWPDQLDASRTQLYISDEKFWEDAAIQPPYPTVSSYDAKLWKYVLKYGQNNDYVWNVGADKN